jgi:[protein-PII] uridylyltransferase
MQFDMYHHYTSTSIRSGRSGLLARSIRESSKDDHPLATGLFKRIASRRALYVAVLLHGHRQGPAGATHSRARSPIVA